MNTEPHQPGSAFRCFSGTTNHTRIRIIKLADKRTISITFETIRQSEFYLAWLRMKILDNETIDAFKIMPPKTHDEST